MGGAFPPLIIFVISSGLIPRSMFSLCCGPQSWMQLQLGSHQGRAEEENPLPHLLPTGLLMQLRFGFLGCKGTLFVELLVHQHPQVFLLRADLNLFIPQPVFLLRIVPTQVQDLLISCKKEELDRQRHRSRNCILG